MKDLFKGMFGMASASGSVIVSKLEGVEMWLRFFAVLGGVLVTYLTIWSLILSIRWKIKNNKKERKENERNN